MKKMKMYLRLARLFVSLIFGKIDSRGYKIITREVLEDSVIQQLYQIYLAAFRKSLTRSVQIQVCYDEQGFQHMMKNERYRKYILCKEGEVVGFSVASLEIGGAADAYANPEYFRHHFPKSCTNGKLWYVTALAIKPGKQGQKASVLLLQTMVRNAHENQAIISFDFSGSTTFLPLFIRIIGRSVGVNIKGQKRDVQTYYVLTCSDYNAD